MAKVTLLTHCHLALISLTRNEEYHVFSLLQPHVLIAGTNNGKFLKPNFIDKGMFSLIAVYFFCFVTGRYQNAVHSVEIVYCIPFLSFCWTPYQQAVFQNFGFKLLATLLFCLVSESLDSSVGIATGCSLDDLSSITGGDKRCFLAPQRWDLLWGLPRLVFNSKRG
jgi:hypothetical protein